MTIQAAPADRNTSDAAEPANQNPTTAVIQPATPWPQYNLDRARAELVAMDLLTRGVSTYRVRQITRLSGQVVRGLAAIVAEEAANPPAPRLVGRTPARQPRQPRQLRPAARRRPQPSSTLRRGEPPAGTVCEPVQMVLSLD